MATAFRCVCSCAEEKREHEQQGHREMLEQERAGVELYQRELVT
jgi:hypothetical protein